VWVLVDLLWYAALIWAVATAKAFFGRPQVRRRLERVSGVVLIGFGIRLVLEAK
jgi:threonine/homoserine/homoserine lactone efflux protein